jgi:hypothetical protein
MSGHQFTSNVFGQPSRQASFQSPNIETSHQPRSEDNPLYRMTGLTQPSPQPERQYISPQQRGLKSTRPGNFTMNLTSSAPVRSRSNSRCNIDEFQSNIIVHPSRPASVNSSSHDTNSLPRSSTMSEGYYRNFPSQQDMSMIPSRQAFADAIRHHEQNEEAIRN